MIIKKLTQANFKQLIGFRQQFVKQKVIMYLQHGIIGEALDKGQITGIFVAGNLVAYIWGRHLVRKPITKLDEICSTHPGAGTVLLQRLEQATPHSIIELECIKTNTRALEFYNKHSFEIMHEKPTNKSLVVLRKKINNNKTLF